MAVYVIAAPALYFHPLIWEVLAYIVEGVIVLGAIGNYLSGRADRRERDGAHHRDHLGHRGETRVDVSESSSAQGSTAELGPGGSSLHGSAAGPASSST
ncbi:MAG: hypothetical protein ACREOA_05940 [Candidatus Dormibacteria bacterium]